VEVYKWWLLAVMEGVEDAQKGLTKLRGRMSEEQIAEGRKLAQDFKPGAVRLAGGDSSGAGSSQTLPESSGS
jgi:hypothetical protein